MKLHDQALSRLTPTMSPEELRSQFLVADLFQPGELRLRWWEVDRTVLGAVVPLATPLVLPNPAELRAEYFLQRREVGVINIGGPGIITVDGTAFTLVSQDALYVGQGARSVIFSSADASRPAQFWLQSYPAHAAYPTVRVAVGDAEAVRLGSREHANERTIFKLLHPGTVKSCQVVLGFTRLEPGSVWNTMPPHQHLRRSEVYLYFDVPAEHAIVHLLGEPTATRHLIVRDRQAVLSPPWSIHSGVGTSAYSFIWGMGGENQEFVDMDAAPIGALN